MIEPNKINEIKKYNNSEFPILSVYLGVDSLQSPSEKFLTTQFHSLIHEQLDDDQRNIFEDDIKRIEDYLKDYKPSDRSLIFFSAGKNLWEVIGFEFSLPAEISISTSPYLEPIIMAQQKYSKYLVLLVDRQKARVFTVEQGEIIENRDFNDNFVPQKRSLTGRSMNYNTDDTASRHNDVLLGFHVKDACETAAKFAKEKNIEFLIIGGRDEMIPKIEKALPLELKNILSGSFVTEINLPLNEILIESKKVAAKIQ
jgi:hypothetical protein